MITFVAIMVRDDGLKRMSRWACLGLPVGAVLVGVLRGHRQVMNQGLLGPAFIRAHPGVRRIRPAREGGDDVLVGAGGREGGEGDDDLLLRRRELTRQRGLSMCRASDGAMQALLGFRHS